MNNPEVQQIMGDPAMRMILEQMQTDPQVAVEMVVFILVLVVLMVVGYIAVVGLMVIVLMVVYLFLRTLSAEDRRCSSIAELW